LQAGSGVVGERDDMGGKAESEETRRVHQRARMRKRLASACGPVV